MRKVAFFLFLLSVPALASGCGGDGDGDNKCDQAANIMIQAFDEACTGKDEETCCLCKCWNDGHKGSADGAECVCTEPTEGECEGTALEQAEACLADEASCKSQMMALVDFACP